MEPGALLPRSLDSDHRVMGRNMCMVVTSVTILQATLEKRSLYGQDKVPVRYGTPKMVSCCTDGIFQPACG